MPKENGAKNGNILCCIPPLALSKSGNGYYLSL